MTGPTLSVTVTNYNYALYLRQNLDSILSQTYEDFELVVIDNASSDGSVELIEEYASRDRRVVPVLHEQNEGMLFSYREAADVARGRYRVHVEADDWVIDPKAFELQITMLEDNPEMSFCYPAMTMIDLDGNIVHVAHPHEGDAVQPGEQAFLDLLTLDFTHTGMMVRQDAYRMTEGYQTGFPHFVDTMLAIRLCEIGSVGYLDRSLYAFRQHGSNVHLEDASAQLKNEYLPMIAAAFDGPLGRRVDDCRAARRRAEQNALVHQPWQCIFTGDLRTGWYLYWKSMRLRPYLTVTQRATAHLVARTVLGARGYRWLEARFSGRRGRP